MTTVDARSPGLDMLGDLVPTSLAGGAAAARAEVVGRSRDAYRALFEHVPAGGLTVTERFTTAVRVAATQRDSRLVGHYQVTAGTRGVSAGLLAAALWGQLIDSPRLAAIWRHADLLGAQPARVTEADVHRLTDVGLDAGAVVTLTQLVGFVAYQARVLSGLRFLSEPSAEFVTPTVTDLGSAGTAQGYSRRLPTWRPWLPPVDDGDTGRPAASVPARVLVREPHIHEARARLDKAVFGAERGLPAGERELAATVTSMVSGCAYSVAVHAEPTARLSGRAGAVDRLLTDGLTTALDERWRAIVNLAGALSQPRSTATGAHVARLRAAGLDDVAVLDVVHATASLVWANRLMLGLGDAPGPGRR